MNQKYIEATKNHFVSCHLYDQEIMNNLSFYDKEYDEMMAKEAEMKEKDKKDNEKE
ncbi:MAG: hypothetical protein ACLU5J_04170 [Christensenellales bacterium]